MTAKEMLRDYLEAMDENEAERVLDLLFRHPPYPPPPLTPEERARTEESRQQGRDGLGIPHEDVMRELEIPD